MRDASLAAAAGFLVYLNALPNPFIWDDFILIVGNPAVKSWGHLPDLFSREMFPGGPWPGYYRPLEAVTFLVDHSIWGLSPAGYHLTNALLHGAVAAALCRLVGALLPGSPAALIAAGLFAVHPVHAETVNYVVHRRYSMSSLLILLALLSYLRSAPGPVGPRRAVSWGLAFLAVLSLEQAAVLPGLIVLADLARARAAGLPFSDGVRRRILRDYLPYAAVVVLFLLLRLAVTGTPTHLTGMAGGALTPWMRLLTFAKAILRYLAWLAVPVRQPFVTVAESGGDPEAVGAVIVVCVLFFAAARAWRSAWPLTFGAAWYLAGLLPFSNFVPLYDLMGERWLYLSSMGVFFAAGWAVAAAARRPELRTTVLCAAGGYALLCGAATFRRNLEWRTNVRIFEAVRPFVPATPTFLGNLATAYADAGRAEEALATFREALALDPRLAPDAGSPLPPGRRAYERALRSHADYADLYANLGHLYRRLGRRDDAVTAFRAALARNPRHASAWNNLGVTLDEAGRGGDARKAFESALAANPGFAHAENNLGNHYFRRGDLATAEAHYAAALVLDPSFAEAHNNLGSVHFRAGRRAQAEASFRRALSLDPSSQQARRNLELLGSPVGETR